VEEVQGRAGWEEDLVFDVGGLAWGQALDGVGAWPWGCGVDVRGEEEVSVDFVAEFAGESE